MAAVRPVFGSRTRIQSVPRLAAAVTTARWGTSATIWPAAGCAWTTDFFSRRPRLISGREISAFRTMQRGSVRVFFA